MEKKFRTAVFEGRQSPMMDSCRRDSLSRGGGKPDLSPRCLVKSSLGITGRYPPPRCSHARMPQEPKSQRFVIEKDGELESSRCASSQGWPPTPVKVGPRPCGAEPCPGSRVERGQPRSLKSVVTIDQTQQAIACVAAEIKQFVRCFSIKIVVFVFICPEIPN